ncbi:MAG: neutral/alkaline non-lysosomal ceramidase N-terminal domain-containing protein, partial [Frankiales bacterium]|nr:neutral/alkaline non-lysosomal ceramidase N-terminal domain-containing protein [Frankiales bacterium]
MKRLLLAAVAGAMLATGAVTSAATAGSTAHPAWHGLRAGVGVADGTWHVGSGAGQYASTQNPTDLSSEWDPNLQHVKDAASYGVASRLSIRAIVLEDGKGDPPVALVKVDNYLAQDMLTRRVAQLLAADGSHVTFDHILMSATHDHNSPYYSTPAAGVWLFQDVMDLRMFEYQARQMASAIEQAERHLVPARVGAATVQFAGFQGNIAGSDVNEDGTPTGYPLWDNDHGVTVLRFDNMTDPERPKPLATYVNYAQHGESLDGYDLISADWLAPFQRFVDRATGAPVVFSQGSVGSAEGPYEYANPRQERDHGQAFPEIFGHMGYAQAERGTHVLAERVIQAWRAIGGASDGVAVQSRPASDVTVRMLTQWVGGPLSHPYPSVGNCRTGPTAGGDPGVPAAGLPDCARSGDNTGVTLPLSPQLAAQLKAAGAPLPDNYDATSFGTVEENARIKLQAVRIGDTLLASCSCEAQSDLVKNLESRTDRRTGDMWLGFDYTKPAAVAEGWPGMHVQPCVKSTAGQWSCPDPRDRWGASRLKVPATAVAHMVAEVNNDAAGWDDPSYVAQAGSEPTDLAAIKGNFTHTELGSGAYRGCRGYAVTVGLGHTGDYDGYTVSYREYQARDAYRKALTSYGPHTADYMVTDLVAMAATLKCGRPLDLLPGAPVTGADEARQTAEATLLGRLSAAYYDGWTAQIPDSAGPAKVLAQPWDVHRFDVTQFRWVGGDNWTDNP